MRWGVWLMHSVVLRPVLPMFQHTVLPTSQVLLQDPPLRSSKYPQTENAKLIRFRHSSLCRHDVPCYNVVQDRNNWRAGRYPQLKEVRFNRGTYARYTAPDGSGLNLQTYLEVERSTASVIHWLEKQAKYFRFWLWILMTWMTHFTLFRTRLEDKGVTFCLRNCRSNYCHTSFFYYKDNYSVQYQTGTSFVSFPWLA